MSLFKRRFALSILSIFLFLLLALPVLATTGESGGGNVGNASSTGSQPPPVVIDNPLGNINTVQKLVGQVISTVLGILGSIALLMFIYGGLVWLTSGGNEKQVTKGRDVLLWATVGLVIIFSSYIILRFVFFAIGV